MEKCKIALISDWYFPKIGGIEHSIDFLARNFSREGHEVHIITRKYPKTPKQSFSDGVSIRRVGEKIIPGQKWFLNPGAYKELYLILKEGNYDVINAHGLDSPLGMSALIAARKLKIPTVITNHSLVGHTPLRPFLFLAGKALLRNADAVIAVSSAVERDSRAMTDKPVYCISNGIDVEEENQQKKQKDAGEQLNKELLPIDKKGKLVIITVSRMTKKKGVKDLVDLAPSLLKSYPNLLFLFVGDGPLREKLVKKVEKLRLSEHFYFTGEIPRSLVLKYLEQADIFALPSRDEAFGISILEAISKKVPVVAMKYSGVSDIIEHGNNGLLAENMFEFELYIRKLIESPATRRELSQKAYEELSAYKWENVCKKVCEVYIRVTDEKQVNQ